MALRFVFLAFFYYCSIGTHAGTRPALHAGISNFIIPFILHYRLCWADLPTGSTHNAIISYKVGHYYLLFRFTLGCQAGLNVSIILNDKRQQGIMNKAGQLALIKAHKNSGLLISRGK